MTEGLFLLTVVFVAYVVYTIVGDTKAKKLSGDQDAAAAPPKKPAKPKPPASAKAAKPKPKPKPKPAAKKPEPKKSEPEKKTEQKVVSSNNLRNPETGETTTVASNYRFVKRWIKEAMVSEGILDRVYKNTELDEANSKKVSEALTKIKTIKKYHA